MGGKAFWIQHLPCNQSGWNGVLTLWKLCKEVKSLRDTSWSVVVNCGTYSSVFLIVSFNFFLGVRLVCFVGWFWQQFLASPEEKMLTSVVIFHADVK